MTQLRWCYHEHCRHPVEVPEFKTLEDNYTETTLFRQWEEQTQAAILSQQSYTLKMILKYYSGFYLQTHSKLHPYIIHMTTRYMSGHRLTQSQYVLPKNIELLGHHTFELEEQLWSTSLLVFRIAWHPVVSVTWFCSTYLPGSYHSKNFPKSKGSQ